MPYEFESLTYGVEKGKLVNYFKELPIVTKTAFALSIDENVDESGKMVDLIICNLQSLTTNTRLVKTFLGKTVYYDTGQINFEGCRREVRAVKT